MVEGNEVRWSDGPDAKDTNQGRLSDRAAVDGERATGPLVG